MYKTLGRSFSKDVATATTTKKICFICLAGWHWLLDRNQSKPALSKQQIRQEIGCVSNSYVLFCGRFRDNNLLIEFNIKDPWKLVQLMQQSSYLDIASLAITAQSIIFRTMCGFLVVSTHLSVCLPLPISSITHPLLFSPSHLSLSLLYMPPNS